MTSYLSADLSAACNALGYFDAKSQKYLADANTLETVKDLIRYLRRDDETHDIRRQLGDTKVLQTDLLPLLKSYWEETDLFDVLLRLIVNLTTPALILWNEELPTEKTARNYYLQIEGHLQSYKEAFVDDAVWAVLSTRLSKILEIEYVQRGDENSLIIERILILIRNILYVPADSMEKRPDNDASLHDQVLWALHQSGMLDIILYITSSSVESAYYLHILEILCFMLREQNPFELAHAALQRSQTEKIRDEAELLAIRHREVTEKRRKTKMFSGTRHSRFGGTFVVKSMKSISDNDLIYHKPLSKLESLNFDTDKTKPKTPKNRLPVKAVSAERRSAFSIRLFLKEFCVEFVTGSYNTLMYHVKDNLVRAKAQAHDESYYLWAMRFFMEFNRCYKFEVKLVSETMSVQTFHYVQQQCENYFDMISTDKKKLTLWSRRLHLALLAYKELLLTLCAMDKSPDGTVRESSKVIKSNIFYVLEYREFILTLLVMYDELKMSDAYLKDLIETQHIFLKMLETFVGKEGSVMVQSRSKKKSKKKKQPKKSQSNQSQPITQELNLDEMWDDASPQLSAVLEGNKEFSSSEAPFDAASDVPIDDQKEDAMKRIQKKLRNGEYEEAIGLFRAAREVWPENDSFGSQNMAPEEEFLALRDVFLADLGENQIIVQQEPENEASDDSQNEENEEEEDMPMYNETNFKFSDFQKRLPHPKIVKACGLALRQFEKNTVNTNHCIVKLLHRIAFDCKMYVMVFQLSIFRSFERIFAVKDMPEYKELVKFATYIVRQFIKVAEVNKKVFMEVLFWKSTKECYDIEHGYTEVHKSTAAERAWSEEQEDELRRLFMEHKNSENQEDVVDWITENLVDQSKSRKQVLRKLKEMMLLIDYKKGKSNGPRRNKNWSSEEEMNLQDLFELYKDSDDPLGIIMQNLDVPRPKNRVIEKLLVMGLIQDRKELRKKRSRKGNKSNANESDNDSIRSQSDSDSDQDDGGSQTSIQRRPKKVSTKSKKSSSGKKKPPKQNAASKSQIAGWLIKIVDAEMQEALEWLKESLNDAIEDYEAGSDEGIPLVPIMDYAESAMENEEFQGMLKSLGISPPFDEQESYWRIPGHFTPDLMKNYCDMILQALDKTLQIEEEMPAAEMIPTETSEKSGESSSEDEDVFSKLRRITKSQEQNTQSDNDEPDNANQEENYLVNTQMSVQEPSEEISDNVSVETTDTFAKNKSKTNLYIDESSSSSEADKGGESQRETERNSPKSSRDEDDKNKVTTNIPTKRKSRIILNNDEDSDNETDRMEVSQQEDENSLPTHTNGSKVFDSDSDIEQENSDVTKENNKVNSGEQDSWQNATKKSHVFDSSDSETENNDKAKRVRSVSDSDSEKHKSKRSRILESDDED